MLKLYNSLTRKIEEFKPLNPPKVGMYTCGPTVYHYQHIGNYRRYIGDDILRRVLEANGYQVKQVVNLTDVGHLISDADEGEDKMEKGARESGRTVWEVAKFYEEDFWKSMDALNIRRPHIIAPATEHINEQIKLIQLLEKNGYTYTTEEAVYFDVSKFKDYTKLSGQKLEDKNVAVREEVHTGEHKKHPHDFALWFFTVGRFKNHTMRWSSPWGEGFPGWHIECSAMAMEYLGNTIDIHTGGVDHLSIHHPNEIAQSEAATGKQFVRYWVHHEFLQVDNQKMSKSLKNLFVLKDLEERGIEPLAFRYLVLTAHYRDKLNFTWESLQAAQNALNNLCSQIRNWPLPSRDLILKNIFLQQPNQQVEQIWQKFVQAANNDLNIPQAVAQLWELVRLDNTTSSRSDVLLMMDQILGLQLDKYLGKPLATPREVKKLLEKRENARKNKDFDKADKVRKEIEKAGFEVEDTQNGPRLKKI